MSKEQRKRLEEICVQPAMLPPLPAAPLVPPICPSAVYACADPQQAAALLAGELPGYVYSRDGHPNADLLADKCRRLHAAQRAAVHASGMAALAAVAVAQLQQGDEVLLSQQLYGRTVQLFAGELARLGIAARLVDTADPPQVQAALGPRTRMLLVETIANPRLRVADIAVLADLVHARGARLVVDNTFASPLVCRPMELGADLVVESLTKIISGHSDVMLGLTCGSDATWTRMPVVQSAFGAVPSPFDCWLALRGLGTLGLRIQRACANAQAAAEMLARHARVEGVDYPGLPEHPDHALARRQFAGQFGFMVTMHLAGGGAAAERFIAGARRILFCPSLGDLSTTLSHPASTSHRLLSAEERAALGISEGTIRLSIGIEPTEAVLEALAEGLEAVG